MALVPVTNHSPAQPPRFDGAGRVSAVASGKELPQQGIQAPPPPDHDTLAATVESLNEHVSRQQRSLHFSVDDSTGRTVISVHDAETGDLVRQIPAEEVLHLARQMEEHLNEDSGLQLIDTHV